MDNELMSALPIAELETLKEKFKDNEAVQQAIAGHLEARAKVEAEAKVLTDFEAEVGKLVNLPPPPEGVFNLYLAYGEVEVINIKAKAEAVEVTNEAGEVVKEMRKPMMVVKQWLKPQINKPTTIKTVGNTDAKTTKRGGTLYQIDGLNLKVVGDFTNATEACNHEKLAIGGDSAMRVLQRHSYLYKVNIA